MLVFKHLFKFLKSERVLFHSQLGKWTEHSSKSYNGFDKLKNSTNFTILEYNIEDFMSFFSLQVPVVGFKPLILRFRVECSGSEPPYSIKLNIKMLFSLSFHTFSLSFVISYSSISGRSYKTFVKFSLEFALQNMTLSPYEIKALIYPKHFIYVSPQLLSKQNFQ
jgi:hypothetical protein